MSSTDGHLYMLRNAKTDEVYDTNLTYDQAKRLHKQISSSRLEIKPDENEKEIEYDYKKKKK